MNIQESITTCFKKYVDFNGRASLSEYWWFFLFCFIVYVILHVVSDTLSMVASLALLLPSLAVLVRRLHDTNTTGWWALLLLIPLLGFLILLYFLVRKGTEVPNEYGAPPIS